jgi:CheY-like chemotaxis protein/HPt (histidine-containing phosphotransfer) domain-containing protein
MPDTDLPLATISPTIVRILVVEDNVLNQRITQKQLQKLGYSADLAPDGLAALAALQRVPYDIVLMDCQMPEMDGYETTWQIRHREGGQARLSPEMPKAYIIALTANTEAADRDKCLAAGMNDYIGKPVQLAELEVALRRAFTNPTTADTGTIDPFVMACLRQLREPHQADPLTELINLFLHDAPTQFQILETAIAGRNMAAALTAASGLKGNAGNLGARRLASLFAEIEGHARAGGLADAVPVLEQARDEYSRVQLALELEKKNAP